MVRDIHGLLVKRNGTRSPEKIGSMGGEGEEVGERKENEGGGKHEGSGRLSWEMIRREQENIHINRGSHYMLKEKSYRGIVQRSIRMTSTRILTNSEEVTLIALLL